MRDIDDEIAQRRREMHDLRIAAAFNVPPWLIAGQRRPTRWMRWSWSFGGWLRARSVRRWDRGVD